MNTYVAISLINVYQFHGLIAYNNFSFSSIDDDSDRLLDLYEALIHILQKCDKQYSNLVVGTNIDSKFNFKLLEKFQSMTSLIMFDTDFPLSKREIAYNKKVDGLLIIITHEDGYLKLRNLIKKFWYTPWIKSMPYVFMLHKSINSCEVSVNLLKLSWLIQLIGYAICTDPYGRFQILTFNPFNSRAPDQWELLTTYTVKGQNWALYVRAYQKENICKQFDFDRTKNLEQYQISVGSRIVSDDPNDYKPTFSTETFENSTKKQSELLRMYTRGIVSALNLSAFFFAIEDVDHRSIKSIYQFFNTCIHWDIDIVFQSFSMAVKKSRAYDYTFPAYCYQSGILVHNRGFKTPLEKIRDFYGIWTLLFTIFVLIVTFLAIWSVENRRIYFAAFEIIRLLTTAGLNTRMNTVPLRIFFSMIFIYFLVIHATFSGHLAEFLTKPELRKHPETLEDLLNFGYYRIYGTNSHNYSLLILESNQRQQFIVDAACWTRIKNDPQAACLGNYGILSSKSVEIDYHTLYYLSKKPFGFQYSYFFIRPNWLLTDRVNHALMWIWESGLREYWEYNRVSLSYYERSLSDAQLDVEFSPITLDELTFAFILLGVGLICATISFIIEIYVMHKKNQISYIKPTRINISGTNFTRRE